METVKSKFILELLSNQELKKDFLKDPKKVLKDKGFKLDENVNYKVLEDTPTTKHERQKSRNLERFRTSTQGAV